MEKTLQPHRTKQLGAIIFSLLLALFFFQITTKHLLLQGCTTITPAEAVEQTQPSGILTLWQTIIGDDFVRTRWLSVLIMPLCFAMTYRYTANLYDPRYGRWAVLANGIICASMAFMGWTALDSLSTLLINVSIVCLWYITNRHINRFAVLLYGGALLVPHQWGLLGLFVGLHGLYAYFFAGRPRTTLSKLLLGYGIALFLTTQLLNLAAINQSVTPIPWYELYLDYRPPLPFLLVTIYAAALLALAAWYADNPSTRQSSALLPIYLAIPWIALALGKGWFVLALGAFTMPLAVALSLGFTNLPQRTKAFASILILVLIVVVPAFSIDRDLQSTYKFEGLDKGAQFTTCLFDERRE